MNTHPTTSAKYHSNYDQSHPSNYGHPSPSSSIGSFNSQSKKSGDVPAAVRSLLVATKQLQDSLQLWSTGEVSDAQISDVYVRFGTEFNSAVQAFAWYGIDMSDLHSIPRELRETLEQCLSEDPSPQILSRYMPEIRQILYSLLEGLKAKQPVWRAAGAPLVTPGQ